MGYKFFPKGLVADATTEKGSVRVFIVIGSTKESVSDFWDKYLEYLKSNDGNPQLVKSGNDDVIKGSVLKANDPLYKGVIAHKWNRFIFGVTKLENPDYGNDLLKKMVFTAHLMSWIEP